MYFLFVHAIPCAIVLEYAGSCTLPGTQQALPSEIDHTVHVTHLEVTVCAKSNDTSRVRQGFQESEGSNFRPKSLGGLRPPPQRTLS